MNWSFLFFVGEPWFVVPWYVVGALGALYLIYDMRVNNTALKPAMKWAWPIIALFFSVIGLALYFATARAPDVGEEEDPERKKEAHHRYEESMWRRVNGAVIHCVAGDGFGIMTGMVIARASGMSFWQEFWFEYLVGFVVGWCIFQRKSMAMMTDSLPRQLAMAFRAEFFSMLTVMAGMGAVMTLVTPMVATAQPKPLTSAFWGFGMLGLLVGFVFTYPMNWMMVKIGWKHGMGGMQAAEEEQVETTGAKGGLLAAMVVLGGAALLLPAWLTKVREDAPLRGEADARVPAPQASPGEALFDGLRASIHRAVGGLESGNRTAASLAMDDALRAAEAGAHSAPGSFYSALEQIQDARIALQQGNEQKAASRLGAASAVLRPAAGTTPPVLDLQRYRGARVVNPEGALIGEVAGVSGGSLELALGGWRDAWGFVDFSSGRRVSVPASALAFGPPRSVGLKLVMVPTQGFEARSASRPM